MSALTLRRYKVVPGQNYDTPKEVWGFRLPPSALPPEETARRALDANADLLGLTGVQRYLRCRHVRQSIGAYHAILSQHHEGLRVHRAYVTVHMSRDRAAYLIKNRAVPKPLLPSRTQFELSAREARRAALATVAANGREFRVLGDRRAALVSGAHATAAGLQVLRLHGSRPLREWIIYVDATNGNDPLEIRQPGLRRRLRPRVRSEPGRRARQLVGAARRRCSPFARPRTRIASSGSPG